MHLEVDSLRQLSAGAETGEAILLRRVARLEASHAPPTLVVRDHEKLDVRVCLAVDERAALLALVARAARRVRCRRRVRRPRDLDAARRRCRGCRRALGAPGRTTPSATPYDVGRNLPRSNLLRADPPVPG